MRRVLLALLLFAPAAARATAERPLKATLTEAHGAVQVCRASGAAWEPAESGATLGAEAQVKTGADGAADLLFEDGTAMHLDKNASLSIESSRENEGKREFSFRLWAGRLLSQVAKRDNPVKYRVQTPTAVAAVRGTEFVTDAAEKTTDLAVFEGEVETQSLAKEGAPLGEPVAVKPEQEISLAAGQPAGPPRAISRAMSEYRHHTAALFRARMDGYRRDMSRVQRLQRDFMERRRRGTDDKMRDFRRNLRRRNSRANGRRP